MNTTVDDTTGARQPRLVYYEPDHGGEVLDTIAAELALRGYRLTSDDSWVADATEPQAMVIVSGGSLALMDGEDAVPLPAVEEFSTPELYARAIADWLDGDGEHTPAGIAEASRTWPVRRSEAVYRVRMVRRWLDDIERHAAADPDQYRSGSPAVTVRLTAEAIAEECARLAAEMTEPVPDDLAESARVELAGAEALAALSRAVRGGAA